MIDKEFEKIPNNVEIERIITEDGEKLGYYAHGHWRRNSMAIATNLEWDETYGYIDFKHGYMRKIPRKLGDWEFELIICARGKGAFPVTYSWD